MIHKLRQVLADNAVGWELPPAGKWSFLVHNNYNPYCSTFMTFWFYEKERFPRVVAKLCRQQQVVEREFRNLQALYPLVPDRVPRPLQMGCVEGFWMLWITGVSGLRIPIRPYYRLDTLAPVVDLVVAVHRAFLKRPGEGGSDRHAQMVAEPLQAVMQFGPSQSIRSGCQELADSASAEWLDGIPVIPQHGDLFLDNVVRHRGQCHLVDWESFGSVDFPYFDLLTLLLSVLLVSGETPEGWNPKLAAQIPVLVRRYARGLGVSLPSLRLLLPLTLAKRFQLQLQEGRRAKAEQVYRALQHYFDQTNMWRRVFLPDLTDGEET